MLVAGGTTHMCKLSFFNAGAEVLVLYHLLKDIRTEKCLVLFGSMPWPKLLV